MAGDVDIDAHAGEEAGGDFLVDEVIFDDEDAEAGERAAGFVFGFSEGRRGGFGGDGEREGASLAELA